MRGTRRGDRQRPGGAGSALFGRGGSLFSSDEEDDSCGSADGEDDGDRALSTLTRAVPQRAGGLATSADIDALLRDLQSSDDGVAASASPARSRLWQSFRDSNSSSSSSSNNSGNDSDSDSAALDLEFEDSALAAEKELDDFFASSDTLLSPLQRATRRPSGQALFFRAGDQGDSDNDSDSGPPWAPPRSPRSPRAQNLLTEADIFGDLSDDDSECPLFLARTHSPVPREHAPEGTQKAGVSLAVPTQEQQGEEKEEEEEKHEERRSAEETQEAGTIEGATVVEGTEGAGMSKSERKALDSALRKYQATLETALGRNTKELTVFEERVRGLRRQLQQDMAKFFSWENRTLKTRYRRFAIVQTAIFQCKEEILLEKSAALGGRLTDIRMLLDAAQKGARVTVQKAFYRSPAVLFASATITAAEARLHALYKEKDRRVAQLREIVSKTIRVSTKERLARLRKIVGEVECDPQRAFYSEPNWDTQREFDSWVRDARTLEGKQMHHVCTAVAQSTQPDATPLDPQEVVLFIDDFSTKLSSTLQKSKTKVPNAKEKLVLLLERSLVSQAYDSLVKLSPEHADFRQLDLAWMDHCEKVKALRQHTPSDALTLSETQLVEPCNILADLPFQVAPTDMIAVVERTISRLCVLGQAQFSRALSADDVIPLLVDVVLRTDLPGLHEALFFMTSLSQEQFRSASVFGWSLVAFQSAVEQIRHTPEQ